MKKTICAIALLLSAPVALAGHHLNGTWKLDVSVGGQGGTATFELKEEAGGKLTGTYQGLLGSEPVTGTVDGANVEFSFDSQAGRIMYKGTFADGSLSGTVDYGSVGSGTFKGGKG